MSTEKPRLHAFVCLICLLSPAAMLYRPADVDGATAMPAGAAIIERVADLVEGHHVDPLAGERIADRLRSDLRQGLFAGVSSAEDLEFRLNRRLDALTPRGEIHVVHEPTARSSTMPDRWVRALVTRGGVGLLDLSALPAAGLAAPRLRAALRGLEGVDSLVVDLRGVDCGDPATARYLARQLLGDEAGPAPHGSPLYLLVDAATGGAAEGLAAELRRSGRATLVGEPTAGRAWAFAELEIADGLLLRTPVARIAGPSTDADWQGLGLYPDLPVPADRALDVAEREALRARGEELPPRPLGIGGSGAMSLS